MGVYSGSTEIPLYNQFMHGLLDMPILCRAKRRLRQSASGNGSSMAWSTRPGLAASAWTYSTGPTVAAD